MLPINSPVVLPTEPVSKTPSALKHWTTVADAFAVDILSPTPGVWVELIFTIFLELSKLTTLPSEDVRPSKDVNVPTTSSNNTFLLNLTESTCVSSSRILSPSPSFSINIWLPAILSADTVPSSNTIRIVSLR